MTRALALILCLLCSGCAMSVAEPFTGGDYWPASVILYSIGVGGLMAGVVGRLFVGGRLLLLKLVLAGAVLMISGCAALPMPLQPHAADTSNTAEGAWLVLHTIDTMQTVQIAHHHNCLRESEPVAAFTYGSKYPEPSRVIATNVVLGLAHTMVTSWLDDEVDSHPGSTAWVWGRRTWLTVSLAYSGYSVAHNFSMGIGPTRVTTPECRQ